MSLWGNPTVTFSWRFDDSRAGCSPPHEQSQGQEILLAKYVSDAPIPESNWKQASDIAAQATRTIDATTLTVFKDSPDNHDIQYSSDTGTVLRIGSQVTALITGITGFAFPRGSRDVFQRCRSAMRSNYGNAAISCEIDRLATEQTNGHDWVRGSCCPPVGRYCGDCPGGDGMPRA